MNEQKERFLIIGSIVAIAILFIFSVCVWAIVFSLLQDGGTLPNSAALQHTPAPVVSYRNEASPTATFAMLESPPSPEKREQSPESPSLEATVILLPNPPIDIPFSDTPTPSPQAQADGSANNVVIESPNLELLSQHAYLDARGRHHIVGEIRNNSDKPVKYVEVIAEYYDTDKLTGANLTFTDPDSIAPHQTVPFDMVILRRPHWVNGYDYKLVVKGYSTDELAQQNVVVVNQTSRLEEGFLYVSGQVKNTGKDWTLVKAVVTLYDANNKVINSRWAYIKTAMLAPGGDSPFEVKLEHQTDAENYHYRIQVEEEVVSDPTILDNTPTPRP